MNVNICIPPYILSFAIKEVVVLVYNTFSICKLIFSLLKNCKLYHLSIRYSYKLELVSGLMTFVFNTCTAVNLLYVMGKAKIKKNIKELT